MKENPGIRVGRPNAFHAGLRPYEHKAQYYETDGMGIIHHSNYIRWFEEARVDMLEQLGIGYAVFEQHNCASPVLSVSCHYRTMVHFAETVQIQVSICRYTGVKLVLAYAIRDKATSVLRCTGESEHCFLNQKTGYPVALSRVWAEAHNILLDEYNRQKDAAKVAETIEDASADSRQSTESIESIRSIESTESAQSAKSGE